MASRAASTNLVTLEGHQKKAQYCHWHPTADSIIASSAFDQTIKIWDISEQEEVCTISPPDHATGIRWNCNGGLLAAACKDKLLHIFDPRLPAGSSVAAVKIHEGIKASKVVWLGLGDSRLITTGFTAQAERALGLWDMRAFSDTQDSGKLTTMSMDTGTGIMFPHFDAGTSMLYIAGRGDGNVRYFEVTGEDPFVHYISDFRSTVPQKGFECLPKSCVDVTKHEIMRGLKLEASCVQAVCFYVPRKSDLFQEDLFPDCPGPNPACTASEWRSGVTPDPVMVSLRPGAEAAAGTGSSSPSKAVVSVKDLKAQLAAAMARIKELEEENEKLKAEAAKVSS
eukprot:NODE_437_length_1565_cov_279.327815.p1 GENE.NODE_437_length_1565_cov_279.327815~~NODE_437_length_1565_cov_279.327815.p1  ORF type:complete len:339 (+),score=91.01 NODE_437_length_1565_cov_279.327815:419-1435(+)